MSQSDHMDQFKQEDNNDEERNYWQKIVDKIYSSESHSITIDLFNSILTKIKIW